MGWETAGVCRSRLVQTPSDRLVEQVATNTGLGVRGFWAPDERSRHSNGNKRKCPLHGSRSSAYHGNKFSCTLGGPTRCFGQLFAKKLLKRKRCSSVRSGIFIAPKADRAKPTSPVRGDIGRHPSNLKMSLLAELRMRSISVFNYKYSAPSGAMFSTRFQEIQNR